MFLCDLFKCVCMFLFVSTRFYMVLYVSLCVFKCLYNCFYIFLCIYVLGLMYMDPYMHTCQMHKYTHHCIPTSPPYITNGQTGHVRTDRACPYRLADLHTYTLAYLHTCVRTYIHSSTLHGLTLHCTTLHFIALHYIALHQVTHQYIHAQIHSHARHVHCIHDILSDIHYMRYIQCIHQQANHGKHIHPDKKTYTTLNYIALPLPLPLPLPYITLHHITCVASHKTNPCLHVYIYSILHVHELTFLFTLTLQFNCIHHKQAAMKTNKQSYIHPYISIHTTSIVDMFACMPAIISFAVHCSTL